LNRNAADWIARAGFLLSGLFCSLPGALLPAWGFDVSSDYASAGRYFLPLVFGLIASGVLMQRIAARLSTRTLLLLAGIAGAAALCALAESGLGSVAGKGALAGLGVAAGFLHAGLFRALLASWERSPALTINSAGIFFGAGSITTALLAAFTFFAWPVERLLFVMAAIPVVFTILAARQTFPNFEIGHGAPIRRQFRSVLALLFAMLLFFQFANEWSIAGWLPLFLIHRFSMNPATALWLLAVYFAAIVLGRIAAYFLIPRANHWRVLAVSGSLSVFACAVLSITDNRFGAVICILLLGIGFAPVYPILAAWIGRRFPDYHPGFFNGIFSVGLAGGLLAPWLLGELAARSGVWAVTTLPAFGTCMVMLLLGLIWLHAKMTGE
jgi:fucose permease